MLRATSIGKLARQLIQIRLHGTTRTLTHYNVDARSPNRSQSNANVMKSLDSQFGNDRVSQFHERSIGDLSRPQIGENISRKDKIKFLVSTLLDLKDSKEAVYGALDAWVAWEKNFPIAQLKNVLINLEKEQQWHKIIQVIKWMLSKGQGNTMGTYKQLIQALDMDHRAQEAHEFWRRKIGSDLHSVPWELCKVMISVYYRNNMLQDFVKLFKGLEAFDRKPPEKSIVRKVADAYEMLGLLEDKERVLVKYEELFTDKLRESSAHRRKQLKKNKSGTNVEGPKSESPIDVSQSEL
ncbi:hypothetical protein ACH5RR_033077 [Cinchona calisaya]|uniref:Pentatricopeptide repeat-containing protein n=1 Tax=Cinchona calisaya TaxID=153742 RepID=A0ABD2YJX7_9GENT